MICLICDREMNDDQEANILGLKGWKCFGCCSCWIHTDQKESWCSAKFEGCKLFSREELQVEIRKAKLQAFR